MRTHTERGAWGAQSILKPCGQGAQGAGDGSAVRALTKGPRWIPSTHTGGLTTTSVPGDLTPSGTSSVAMYTGRHTHTYRDQVSHVWPLQMEMSHGALGSVGRYRQVISDSGPCGQQMCCVHFSRLFGTLRFCVFTVLGIELGTSYLAAKSSNAEPWPQLSIYL